MSTTNKYALLVIDLINDIINPEGKMPSCAAYLNDYPVIVNTNKIIQLFRDKKLPIIFIRIAFPKDYKNLPNDWAIAKEKQAFQDGTWSTEIDERVDFDEEHDFVITKNRVSPFYNTTLADDLNKLGVNKLIITGVATNNAPDLCAREAWDRDLQPTIITDACGAANTQLHKTALFSLPPVIKQLITADFITELSNQH